MKQKPFVGLIILDGFGIRQEEKGNAIKLAQPKHLEALFNNNPYTELHASGTYVGLPEGQIGNSEVGHLNIGAGKVVYQSLLKINNAIKDKSFHQNKALLDLIDRCKKQNKTLHLMGLLSDGGVHSHINHLFALIDVCQQQKLKDVVVHCFLDGRDTYRDSGVEYLAQLETKLQGTGYKIATIMGRYYAMDRESNFDRTKEAYEAMTKGVGRVSSDYQQLIRDDYHRGVYDEYVPPIVVNDCLIKDNDGVVFYNFREDRARQLTRVLTDKDFNLFETNNLLVDMVTFVSYDDDLTNLQVMYPKQLIEDNLSAIISKNGLRQFKISETTKYAHVTYFLNGGIEQPYKGEDRFLIETLKCKTFDETPAMRAKEITETAIAKILTKKYNFMTLNYSNCDMLGHTGNLQATIESIKIIDQEVQKLVDAILSIGGVAIITADHGNAEHMIDDEGKVLTDHTTNLVPFCVIGAGHLQLAPTGSLCHIAPTILQLLGVQYPMEKSLIL